MAEALIRIPTSHADVAVLDVRLLDEDVSPAAHEALAAEAGKLTEWLDGQRVFAVYPSPAMQPGAGR